MTVVVTKKYHFLVLLQGGNTMAKNTSIALGDHFKSFVERKIQEGRFGSVSEAVRAGLRLLEEREAKLQVLRKAIQEGVDSGPSVPFDVEDFLSEMEREKQRD